MSAVQTCNISCSHGGSDALTCKSAPVTARGSNEMVTNQKR